MKKLSLLSLLLLLALLAAACQPAVPLPPIEAPATAAPAAPAPTQAIAQPGPEIIAPAAPVLAGTAWIMSSLNGDAAHRRRLPSPCSLGWTAPASGSDGCNRYTTMYNQLGDSLTFMQPMAGTMMACDEAAHEPGGRVSEGAGSVTRFTMSSRQLVLFAGDEIVLTYIADVQALEGTAWSVVNYNNGREAVVGVLDGNRYHAQLRQGRAERQCRAATTTSADTRSRTTKSPSTPLGSTMRICEAPEGVMEQEQQYLAALQTAATFRIEGDELWLRTAGDAIAVIAVKEQIVDLPAPEPQTPTGTVTGASVLNIRSGPGTNFPVIGAARQGDTGTIVGRSQDGRWWAVDAPALPGGIGWVSVDFVAATNAENVPVVASPPTPVPTPTRVPRHGDASAARPRRPTAPPTAVRAPDQLLGRPYADQPGRVRDAQLERPERAGVWVYPQGSNFNAFPRTGQGNERVCPPATTTYETARAAQRRLDPVRAR